MTYTHRNQLVVTEDSVFYGVDCEHSHDPHQGRFGFLSRAEANHENELGGGQLYRSNPLLLVLPRIIQ